MSRDSNSAGFKIHVERALDIDDTFIYNNSGDTVIEISSNTDPKLVKRFDEFLMYMQEQYSAYRLGCIECGSEFCVSEGYTDEEIEGHSVNSICCPKCEGDLINLAYEANADD